MRLCYQILMFVLLSTASISAQSSWEYRYVVGSQAGDITSCNAEIRYTDGAILARIHGENLDFYFSKLSFALPPSTELGRVAFLFKTADFVLPAFSGLNPADASAKVSHLFLYPNKSDYAALLENMRVADSFSILFPDETSYRIELTGSNKALTQAGDCWKNNPTGPFGENPFNSSDGNKENPF